MMHTYAFPWQNYSKRLLCMCSLTAPPCSILWPNNARVLRAKWRRLGAIAARVLKEESLPTAVKRAWAASLNQVVDTISLAQKALSDVAFSTGPEEDKNYAVVMAEAAQAVAKFDEIIAPAQKLITKQRKAADGAEEASRKRKRAKKVAEA